MTDTPMGLVVDVEARINKLEQSLKKANEKQRKAAAEMEKRAKQSADKIGNAYEGVGHKIGRAFEKMPGALKGLGGAFLGGVAGGIAVGSIDQFSKQIAATTKEVANLKNEASRAGVTTTVFQEWKFLADQNRISVDALTNGFKEMHLRAGEFFLDGTGAGAEAFKKLGYSAEELKTKLKDPSALMTEILGKLKNFDQAGRSFLLEEIFGGAGGEQFAVLIGQGEAALRQTIQRAHETGAVLEAELIDKAAQVDRKFSELSIRMESFGKRATIAFAEAAEELLGLRQRLDEAFDGADRARAVLGAQLYGVMDANPQLVNDQIAGLQGLEAEFQNLATEATRAGLLVKAAAGMADSWGLTGPAADMQALGAEVDALTEAFRGNEITGEEFAERLQEVQARAVDAFAALEDGDRVRFDGVIGELGRLGGVIGGLIGRANDLHAALARAASVDPASLQTQALRSRHEAEGASMDSLDALRGATQRFTEAEGARNAATTEGLKLDRERAGVRERAAKAGVTLTEAEATAHAQAAIAADAARIAADKAARAGGGGGGGGGGAKKRAEPGLFDDTARDAVALQRQLDLLGRTTEEVARLEARWALLDEAKKRGIPVNEALNAQIDAQAQKVGQLTGELERGEIGRDRFDSAVDGIADSLAGVLTGEDDLDQFRQNVADTLRQTARDILTSGIKDALNSQFGGGMGGAGGNWLTGLLGMGLSMFTGGVRGNDALSNALRGTGGFGFASGGYTGKGGTHEPAGIVHRGEFVLSAAAVRNIGVDNLEALHRSARAGATGYAAGGLVGKAAKATRASEEAHSASTAVPINISAPVTVNSSGGSPEQNAHLARQIAVEQERALRGLVQDEMVRQMKPGGMMRR